MDNCEVDILTKVIGIKEITAAFNILYGLLVHLLVP